MNKKERPRWKIRKDIFERDNNRCQICHKREKLEIHHIDGRGSQHKMKDMNNEYDNLVLLCHKCHIKLEAEKRGGRLSKNNRQRADKERKAILLYKEGLSTREIGNIIGRSHTWVWNYLCKIDMMGK